MNNRKPSAAQTKSNNTSDAYGDVDNAFSQGTSFETLSQNITNNAAGYAAIGLDYKPILAYAKAKYTASQDAYTASGPTLAQRAANSLTASAFKRW